MGKAQSKRSVDITTESKDGVVEEGTGKMGKIEDVDQLKPQMNGDTHNETENTVSERYIFIFVVSRSVFLLLLLRMIYRSSILRSS